MNTFIALLRGINVGGRNILPMSELVGILEAMNFESVQTYIQSGNVAFRTKKKIPEKISREISEAILEKKAFKPKVMVLSSEQLQDAMKGNPFPQDNGKVLHFYFLESKPLKPNIEQLELLKSSSEEFKLFDRIFYLYAPDGIGRSKLAAAVEKMLGVQATARNWNTVSKLVSVANIE